MTDIVLKYNLLNKSARKEVSDFIDFLLARNSTKKLEGSSDYKKKILNVSTWSETDIKVLIDNQQKINQWKAQEW